MSHIQRLLRSADQAQSAEQSLAAAERFAVTAADRGLIDIRYASVDSPFGSLLAAATRRGLLRLAFPEEDRDLVLEGLSDRVSPRILRAQGTLDDIRRELDEYFAGRRRIFELRLDWQLISPFARRVLRGAAAIPYGGLGTYMQLAERAGSPRGSRAVGNALGSNPIPIVIPCHRVLRTGGGLGGYAGGLERKRFLLELEGAMTEQLF